MQQHTLIFQIRMCFQICGTASLTCTKQIYELSKNYTQQSLNLQVWSTHIIDEKLEKTHLSNHLLPFTAKYNIQ